MCKINSIAQVSFGPKGRKSVWIIAFEFVDIYVYEPNNRTEFERRLLKYKSIS